jgi:very-short-patch-repair endonuclease
MAKKHKQSKEMWYVTSYKNQVAHIFNDWKACEKSRKGKPSNSHMLRKFTSQEEAVAWAKSRGHSEAQIKFKLIHKKEPIVKDAAYYQAQIKQTSKGWHIAYKNKKAFVFDNWSERKHVLKCATYEKGFETKGEALGCLHDLGYETDQIKVYETTPFVNKKICPVCGKIYGGKNKLCPSCNTIKKRLGLTIWVMCAIQNHVDSGKTIYSMSDEEIMRAARIIWSTKTKEECVTESKEKRAELRSAVFRKEKYERESFDIPDYIRKFFEKDKTKEIICVDGYKINPRIYYTCKRCGCEICQTYEDLRSKKGHGCSANKSSGEVLVEEYLKQIGVFFKTQRDTLECINPKTKRVMPYDFELQKNKIIIEVQGKQHFEFIEHFHGTIDNFEYQQWKDEVKKEFAERVGYRVVYIDYHQLESSEYKTIIDAMLNLKHTKD